MPRSPGQVVAEGAPQKNPADRAYSTLINKARAAPTRRSMCSLGHPREPPPRALLHRLELLPPVDAVPQPLELLHAALVLAALELAERRRRRRRPVLALAEVPAVELPEGEPAVVALGIRQEVGERLVRVAVVVEAAVEPRQVVAAERARRRAEEEGGSRAVDERRRRPRVDPSVAGVTVVVPLVRRRRARAAALGERPQLEPQRAPRPSRRSRRQ